MHAVTSEPIRGPKRPAVATPGYGGGDMRFTGMTTVKGCRTSAAQWHKDGKPHAPANVRTAVGVCSGYVWDAHTMRPLPATPKNAKHIRRRMAKGTQNMKGINR